MTKKAVIRSVSIPSDLDRICRDYCRSYSISFSSIVQNALMKYFNEIDSVEQEGMKLHLQIQRIEATIRMARKLRDAMIRDGSGLQEIRELRVTGTYERKFKPHLKFYKYEKGKILNDQERIIYDKLCGIIEKGNNQRIKILQNPVYIKWLTRNLEGDKQL